jgi:hypothetical protein
LKLDLITGSPLGVTFQATLAPLLGTPKKKHNDCRRALSLTEVERYTKAADQKRLAKAAMDKQTGDE